MLKLLPDQSFYPSPGMAMKAAPETLAYVALLNPDPAANDAMAVLDLDPASPRYGTEIGRVAMPDVGDELHHFGWNACSSCLCPHSPHPHMERRYLLVPGMRSSRIHILDTKPDPRQPQLVKVIEAGRSDAARPATAGRTPRTAARTASTSARSGDRDGNGPGGIFMLDPETFEIKGRWELDRGPQYLSYDFWWHLGHDTMITSEWGTPNMVENGVNPELLLGGKYGHALHVWDLRKRRHLQTLDLGAEHQMVLELRPRTIRPRPTASSAWSPALKDLSASIWIWHREGERRRGRIRKVIEIPAEPADRRRCCRRCSRASARCRRWSPTSTSRSTTGSSTSRAGAPASCSSTTSPIPSTRLETGSVQARRHRPPRRRIRPVRTRRSTARRRWWRSAATVARLLHQLALPRVGRPVLSRRHQGLDGQGRRRAERRHAARLRASSSSSTAMRPHQVHLEGGDASSGLVLLLVR